MSHPLRRLALFGALVALAAACTASARPAIGGGQAVGEVDAVVFFVNNSLEQANVYAVTNGGTSTRIGAVFSGRRERLRLPGTAFGGGRTVEFRARLLTQEYQPNSGPITLNPGDSIEVTLSNDGTQMSVLPLKGRRP